MLNVINLMRIVNLKQDLLVLQATEGLALILTLLPNLKPKRIETGVPL